MLHNFFKQALTNKIKSNKFSFEMLLIEKDFAHIIPEFFFSLYYAWVKIKDLYFYHQSLG